MDMVRAPGKVLPDPLNAISMPALMPVDAISFLVFPQSNGTKLVRKRLFLAPIALHPCPGTVPENKCSTKRPQC